MEDETAGIHCPSCGSIRHEVFDTRMGEMSIRRRRKCKACNARFTTFEMTEMELPTVGRAQSMRVHHAVGLAKRLVGAIERLGDADV